MRIYKYANMQTPNRNPSPARMNPSPPGEQRPHTSPRRVARQALPSAYCPCTEGSCAPRVARQFYNGAYCASKTRLKKFIPL